jgi:hypothetical protein
VVELVVLAQLVVQLGWARHLHTVFGLDPHAVGRMVLGEASSIAKSRELAIAALSDDAQCGLHVLTTRFEHGDKVVCLL